MKFFAYLLLAVCTVSFSGCFNLEDDQPGDIIVVKPDVTVNIGDVIVTNYGDTIDVNLYSPIDIFSPVLVNNVDNSMLIVHGSQAWAVSHSSSMTYHYVDESGQKFSVPVTVHFGEGAISFNNQVYTPITINSPVYVNLEDNSRVIVEGDNIYNVTHVDSRTYLDQSGQETIVEVNFAEGAIAFDGRVYVENNNSWYSDDDVWIKIEGDTITQKQMSKQVLHQYNLALTYYAVLDSFPMVEDTLLIPSTDTLVSTLFDGNSTQLRNNHSGISIQDVLNVGLPLNLSAGTGNFNWFFPADSTVGLYYAVARVSSVVCADDSFMIRLYDMSGADSATLIVSTTTTDSLRDVCDALSTNGNNITMAKYFAYRVVNKTAGIQVSNSAISVRSYVDPSQGITLKTYVNPDPQVYPVTGLMVVKKSNAFKRFDPTTPGLEQGL